MAISTFCIIGCQTSDFIPRVSLVSLSSHIAVAGFVAMTDEEALLDHNLAPQQTRRDVATLGLIHRTVLELGPPQFKKWFFLADKADRPNTRGEEKRHSKQLYNHLGYKYTELLRRAVQGQVRVYNELPQVAVNKTSVSSFQGWLQDRVKERAREGREDWANTWNKRRSNYYQPTNKQWRKQEQQQSSSSISVNFISSSFSFHFDFLLVSFECCIYFYRRG